MAYDIHIGDVVEWDWARARLGEGDRAVHRSGDPDHQGTEVTRNATEDEPAYVLRPDPLTRGFILEVV
jgi:hypothetical protein